MKDQRRTKSIARRLPFWRVEVYLDVAAVLHEEVAEGAGFHGDLVAVGLVGLVVLVLVALLGLVLVAQGQRLVVKVCPSHHTSVRYFTGFQHNFSEFYWVLKC